jgi:hypothetical protein
MKQTFRVSYAFVELSVLRQIAFTQVLIICLTGNAAFTKLPVALADLQALLQALIDANNNVDVGGSPNLTALRGEAQQALLVALRKNAAYVQSVSLDSLSTLLSSGFQNVPAPSASGPLDAPTILKAANNGTTRVLLRLSPVTNANSYEIQYTTDGGKTWVSGAISSQARSILVTSLTPGTVYTIQARALGGSTGQSIWSTPVSIMAT